MKNGLTHTLGFFGWHADAEKLDETVERYYINGDICYFCFDLLSDKCRYFCPSITRILGYDHRKYQNKGFTFFRKLIHPNDFLIFIDEVITLVTSAEKSRSGIYTGNSLGIVIRIRHKNGDWQKLKVSLLMLKEATPRTLKILLGFVRRVDDQEESGILLSPVITEREKEVFRYLSDGDSAKMIAGKLNISESTVVSHRKNLIEKLGAKNSAELIRRGFELNILNSAPLFT